MNNGAYTGCEPPGGMQLCQQSATEDNDPLVDLGVESIDPDSGEDLSACDNIPASDNDESMQSCVTTISPENSSVVNNLSYSTADEESIRQSAGPLDSCSLKQQSDAAKSSDISALDESMQSCITTNFSENNSIVNNLSYSTADEISILQSDEPVDSYSSKQQSGASPSSDISVLDAVSLPNTVTEVDAYCDAENVKNDNVALHSQIPVVDAVVVDNCESNTVSPLVVVAPLSSLPSADVCPSAVSCVQECAPDSGAVRQLQSVVDVTVAVAEQNGAEYINTTECSPQCVDESYGLNAGAGLEAPATKQYRHLDILHCAADGGEEMRTSETRSGNSLVDSAQASCAVHPLVFSILNKCMESCEDDRAFYSNANKCSEEKSDSSDKCFVPSVASGSQPAQNREDFTHNIISSTDADCDNPAMDYGAFSAATIISGTTTDISPSVQMNSAAHFKLQASVPTDRPAAPTNRRSHPVMSRALTGGELRRKIMRQLEVCVKQQFRICPSVIVRLSVSVSGLQFC